MQSAITLMISAVGLVGCVSFMVAYHVRSGGTWRHNEIGLWLMTSRIVLAGIFALIISRYVWGDWAGRETLIMILVALFALQTFWPSKFIWRPEIHGIRRPRSSEVDHDSRP